MHIVFVTTELATDKNASGGLASFVANMARIFAENGHKVSIILSTVKESEISFDDNIRLIKLHVPLKIWKIIDGIAAVLTCVCSSKRVEVRRFISRLYSSRNINKKIKKMDKQEKVDIVHFTNLSSVSFFANRKIPYIVRLSGLANLWRGTESAAGEFGFHLYPLSLLEKQEEYVIKKSKYVISPSKYLAELTKNNLNPRVAVIESPFLLNDKDWDYEIYNRNLKGKKYIIHYGRLGYLKGTHVICQLAKELLEKNPDLYIVMAGRSSDIMNNAGNSAKVEDVLVESAGEYADRVVYLGRLVREQLYPVIQNAEACIFPSRIENLANACIEAMAMGKIVVATDGVSFDELIEDGISGFLCQRDDKESFMQGIMKALKLNEAEKEQMGLNAKKSVERLEPQKVYQDYLNYYQKVIAN